jgi:hypothetical protein
MYMAPGLGGRRGLAAALLKELRIAAHWTSLTL